MHPLLLATRNAHKTREFSDILGNQFVVRDLGAEPDAPAIEETGATFAENAILKAVAISKQFPGLVVADDSGLEVDALNSAPGVYSARYAGPEAKDEENIVKLLGEIESRRSWRNFPSCDPGERQVTNLPHARFRCVLALARDGELLDTFEGVVEGTIVDAPRGTAGFGYDPVFQPAGLTKTFAELSAVEKNRISHRAGAIRLLRGALID